MARTVKAFKGRAGTVDAVHHAGVGTEHEPGGVVLLFFAKVDGGQLRQIFAKAAFRLCNQGIAVGQKENAFCPVVFEQDFYQGGGRTGFPASGSHYQEGLPVVAL